jgi:hypothetical protein
MTTCRPRTLLHTTFLLAALGGNGQLAAQDARFVPIPGRSAIPGTNANFCGLSGTAGWSGVRVSGDGQVVGTIAYSPGFWNGFVPRQAIRWTEATGSVVISPDLDGLYPVVGMSFDGSTIYGETWRWRANGGYASLRPALSPGQFQSRLLFDCAFDGVTVAGIQGLYPGPGDAFLWALGTAAAPTILPRAAGFPDGWFYFTAISGDGQVFGGSLRQIGVGPGGSDFTAGAIATVNGTLVLTATCPQAGVTDLSPAGNIAVGFEQAGSTMRAFRWEASTGLVYLDATGPAGDGSYARATNFDGTVVVGDYLRFGQPGTRAFVWTPASGLVDLQDELVQQRGLGAALAGWQLLTATDVDFTGNTIVGQGINPNGCEQAFVVRLPRVLAATNSYGIACTGPAGALTLTSATRPYVGTQFFGECTGAVAGAAHFAVYGFQTAATPLASLNSLGGACDLLTVPATTLFAPVVNGVVRSGFAIPNQPAVAGLALYLQILQLEGASGKRVGHPLTAGCSSRPPRWK